MRTNYIKCGVAGLSLGVCMCLSASSFAENLATPTMEVLSIDAVRPQPTCSHPDSHALAAILPLATDSGHYASAVVFDNNRVLTAAHALHEAQFVYVKVDGIFRVADVIMVDHAQDLAVLAVNTLDIEPIPMTGLDPDKADPVWAVGYPRAQAMSTSMGIFQNALEGAIHTSAPIDSGQSGGGLLTCDNGRWSLAGMLKGYGAYLEGGHYVKLQNHSVSIAAATINRFLLTYH